MKLIINNPIVSAVVALIVVGSAVTGGVYLNNRNPKEPSTNSSEHSGQDKTLEDLNKKLTDEFSSYTGEQYDQKYMEHMVGHHQGAVGMAKLALTNSKRPELKELANNIISSQSKEISDMTAWQSKWGYTVSVMAMPSHGSSNTHSSTDPMVEQLTGKSGDDFDRTFLSLMLEHHQSAVAVSTPAQKNASHQEIKDLAATIIKTQTEEITQMRAWQKEWGYTN